MEYAVFARHTAAAAAAAAKTWQQRLVNLSITDCYNFLWAFANDHTFAAAARCLAAGASLLVIYELVVMGSSCSVHYSQGLLVDVQVWHSRFNHSFR